MSWLMSRLILLVGISLMFYGCGSGTETASSIPKTNGGSTNIPNTSGSTNTNTDSGTNVVVTNPSTNEGSSSGTTTVATKKLLFVDATCSGLTLNAINVSNNIIGKVTTDSDGVASVPTDTTYVQFEIGGVVLGKVESSGIIAISELFKNSSINDKRVLFLSRLLLTIDSDQNVENGINIDSAISTKVGTFKSSTGYIFGSFDKTESEVTAILTEFVNYLGWSADRVVSQANALAHLKQSMTELEDQVTTVTLNAGDDANCPNGGIKRIHNVDFDKTDSNSSSNEYVDYFCDKTNSVDQTKSYELSSGNDKCPDGGLKIHHTIYSQNSDTQVLGDIVSEYDEYRCNGASAYQTNTFVGYSIGTSSESCQKVSAVKTKTVTNESGVAIQKSTENICLDKTDYTVSVVQLLSNDICQFNGLRVDYSSDDEIVETQYLCNQKSSAGFIAGEHKISAISVTDTSICPDGGIEFQHSADNDNNGEFETNYSEIKCSGSSTSSSNESKSSVITTSTNVLLTSEMNDFSKCPNGGFRIEKIMKQDNRIIAEYNDYNCTPTATNMNRDEVTPVALKYADYSKDEGSKNIWCPNGGIKYEHKVYFNDLLNYEYYDINCSPHTTNEINTTIELKVADYSTAEGSKNIWCPNGGKLVSHKVIFNGDIKHFSNYEYNTIHCVDLNWEDSYESNETNTRVVLAFGDSTCLYGGIIETHKRFKKADNEYIAQWDYNTTTCSTVNYNEVKDVATEIKLEIGNAICPDGGKIIQHQKFADNQLIASSDYNETICDGLNWSDTYEKVIVVDNKPAVCPYGGKIETHQRFTNGSGIHVAKWDYNTTTCSSINYNETREVITEVELEIGSTICPDGGKVIQHQRFGDFDNDGNSTDHIAYWDYNETICEGLNWNDTREETVELNASAQDCPYGGTVIQHQRWIGDVHVTKWDYNSTYCTGDIVYKANAIAEYELPLGDSSCPTGGKIVTFVQTNNDVKIGEYNSTFCGQESGEIIGHIKDINKSPISGARISISVDGQINEISSDINGSYKLSNVQKGTTVTISAEGYLVVEKQLLIDSGIVDFTLVSSKYASLVKDLKLIFFPIHREIGGDVVQELAKAKGWRLLTFEELLALYYSERRSEFSYGEYFSSSHEFDNSDGYTLWTLRFPDAQVWPHWFTNRKHAVFVDEANISEIPALDFVETNIRTDFESARSICSTDDKRLPTVEEFKNIYFHSSHPFGIADSKLLGGEYWTADISYTDSTETSYTSKFFRVVGPVEDYHLEDTNIANIKRVLCVIDDSNRTVQIKGSVSEAVNIKFERINSAGERTLIKELAHSGGEFNIDILAGRYLVSFGDIKNATYDFTYNRNLHDINLAVAKNDNQSVCGLNTTVEKCDQVAFNASSNYDENSQKWTYKVVKGEGGNVDLAYYTVKIGSVCMEQIQNLTGGTAIALNDLGIIDGIQAYNKDGEMSFSLSSNIKYDSDVETALTIFSSSNSYTANIATPICEKQTVVDNTAVVNVSGYLYNTSGAGIANASVSLFDENNNSLAVVTTDSTGKFEASSIKSGTKVRFAVVAVNYKLSDFYGSVTESVNSFTFTVEKLTETIKMYFHAQDNTNGKLLTNTYFSIKSEDKVIGMGYSNSSGIFEFSFTREVGTFAKGTLEVNASGYETKVIEDLSINFISKYPVMLTPLPSTLQVLVYDSNGIAIENADVSLYSEGGSTIIQNQITTEGKATFSSVAVGNYVIKASLSDYDLSAQTISVKSGAEAIAVMYLIPSGESSSSEIKTIKGSASEVIFKYKDSNPKGTSMFRATVNYTSEDGIWNYKIEKLSTVGAGSDLSHWYLDLNDKCLENLENVTAGSSTGIDGSTTDVVPNSSSVLKWDTTGGTFSFKIKKGVEFDSGSTVKVPLLFKAGTVGNLPKEGFVIVEIPAPVCK